MRNKIDFSLKKEEDYEVIFRFYPRRSHCHSFNDDVPKTRNDVYKVYYSYAIIGKSEDSSEILFEMPTDECSILEYLGEYIRNTINDKRHNKAITIGQPGSDWDLLWRGSYIEFRVFDNWTDRGFRFWLTIERAEDFIKYLDTVNQYMIEHGEPI